MEDEVARIIRESVITEMDTLGNYAAGVSSFVYILRYAGVDLRRITGLSHIRRREILSVDGTRITYRRIGPEGIRILYSGIDSFSKTQMILKISRRLVSQAKGKRGLIIHSKPY